MARRQLRLQDVHEIGHITKSFHCVNNIIYFSSQNSKFNFVIGRQYVIYSPYSTVHNIHKRQTNILRSEQRCILGIHFCGDIEFDDDIIMSLDECSELVQPRQTSYRDNDLLFM